MISRAAFEVGWTHAVVAYLDRLTAWKTMRDTMLSPTMGVIGSQAATREAVMRVPNAKISSVVFATKKYPLSSVGQSGFAWRVAS